MTSMINHSEHSAIRFVLFDIDRTILTSNGTTLLCMTKAAQAIHGPSFNFDGIVRSGRLDPQIYHEALTKQQLKYSPADEASFKERYLEILEQHQGRITILPGVEELLSILAQKSGLEIGLTTGNYSEAAWIKLRAVKLNTALFKHNGFGEDANSRAGMIQLALNRCRASALPDLQPDQVLVLGDTPRDIEAANSLNCRSLGVCTGDYDSQALRKASPDYLLKDLNEQPHLWSDLGFTNVMELK